MSKGGGGGGNTTQTVKNDPPAYLKPFLEGSLTEAQRLYDQGARPMFPGQTYSPMNAMQNQALQGTLQRAQDGSPLMSAAQGSLTNILNSTPGQNPYMDQLLDTYGKKANALVTSNMNAAGRFGSGSHVGTAAREVTNATLPLLFDQYNKDQQMQLAGSALAPQLANEDFNNLSRIGAVGDVYQGYDDQALQEQIARFNYDNGGAESGNLDEYLARVYGNPLSSYGSSNTTGRTSGGGGGVGGTLGNVIGGLGTLGGLGSGLSSFLGGGSALAGAMGGTAGTLGSIASFLGIFSDRRLKENIKPAGSQNGFNLYTFNYRYDPKTTYIGVMADEIQNSRPDAIRMIDGYMAVDYRKLGLEMKEVTFPEADVSGEGNDHAAAGRSRRGSVEQAGGGAGGLQSKTIEGEIKHASVQ